MKKRRRARACATKLSERRATVAALAATLRQTPAGKSITVATIQADVKLNPALLVGGKIDLVRYAAWLLRQHGYGGQG